MMTTDDIRRLGKFLKNELDDRGMSQADLARSASVTRSNINGIITGTKRPSTNLILAIAKSLNIPPEKLYREAGLLPGRRDSTLDKLNFMITQLPNEDQQDVYDYIDLKIKQKERKSGGGMQIPPCCEYTTIRM